MIPHSPSAPLVRYSRVAVALHWAIAVCIVVQLTSGLWMHDAIHEAATKALAFRAYQWHKALGLTVLVLAALRLLWRITHRAPPLPATMKPAERIAAHIAHGALYVCMFIIPLLGWAMVSSSPFGLPTLYFGLFEWPHLPYLAEVADKKATSDVFGQWHLLISYALMGLLALHVLAVIKHQCIHKDGIIKRMMF